MGALCLMLMSGPGRSVLLLDAWATWIKLLALNVMCSYVEGFLFKESFEYERLSFFEGYKTD